MTQPSRRAGQAKAVLSPMHGSHPLAAGRARRGLPWCALAGVTHASLLPVPLASIGAIDIFDQSEPGWKMWTGACVPGRLGAA